jgi:hypothetical protein
MTTTTTTEEEEEEDTMQEPQSQTPDVENPGHHHPDKYDVEVISVDNTDTIDYDNDSSHDDSGNANANTKQSGRRKVIMLTGIFVVLMIVAITLGVTLGKPKDDRQQQNQQQNQPPPQEVENTVDLDEQQEVEEDVEEVAPPVKTIAPTTTATVATTDDTTLSDTKVVDGTAEDIVFPPDATSWPLLVGMDGEVAAKLLEEAYPGTYDIYVLSENSLVTLDYNIFRIRIFVSDDTNKVVVTPMVG